MLARVLGTPNNHSAERHYHLFPKILFPAVILPSFPGLMFVYVILYREEAKGQAASSPMQNGIGLRIFSVKWIFSVIQSLFVGCHKWGSPWIVI